MLFDRIESMGLEHRTYNFNDEFIQQMYTDAEQPMINKIKEFDASH